MRPQPLIAVSDVEASSRWYQQLLGCRSAHGGPEYERLMAGDRLVLQLHRFDVGHHHGLIGDRNELPYGNGVLLWSRPTISMPPSPARTRSAPDDPRWGKLLRRMGLEGGTPARRGSP